MTDSPLLGAELATPLSEAYWRGLPEGRLVLQRCANCGVWQHYPRRHCRACWSDQVVPEAIAGRGRVIAAVLSHRTPKPDLRDRLPMVLGLVATLEGPVLLAVLHGDPAGSEARHDAVRTRESGLLTFTCETEHDGEPR